MMRLKLLTLYSLFLLVSCRSSDRALPLMNFMTIMPKEISGQIDEPYELALQNYFDCQNKQSSACQLHLRMARDAFLRTAYLKFDLFSEQGLIPKDATLSDVGKAIASSDQENTVWLKLILGGNIWFTSEEYGSDVEKAAWLLVQHSDHDREFQRSVLRRLEPLLVTGSTRKNAYALLYDRVAVAEGRLFAKDIGLDLFFKAGLDDNGADIASSLTIVPVRQYGISVELPANFVCIRSPAIILEQAQRGYGRGN